MKELISFLIIIWLSSSLYAQKVDTLHNLDLRVEKLELFQDNLDKKYENKSTELDNKFNKLEYQNKKDNNRIDILVWIFGSITVIGLLLGWFTVYKTAIKVINEKMEVLIEKYLIDKKQEFIKLIQNHEFEHVLKEKKEIQILSFNQIEENTFKSYSNKLDFKNIRFSIIDTENEFESIKHLKNADVIVINNINNSFTNEFLLSLVQTYPDYKNSFTYYGLFNKDLAGYKNINFANSEFTLYSRIIETLKIQDILTK